MKKLLSILILIAFCICKSQTPDRDGIDNLKNQIKKLDPSVSFLNNDTVLLLTEIYYKSKELKYNEGELHALDYRSNLYYNTGRLKEALKDLDEGTKLAKELNDYYQLANLSFGKGFCYTKLGLHDKALTFYKEGFNYAEKIKNKNKYHYVRMSLLNGMMWNANTSKNYNPKTSIDLAEKVYKEARSLDEDFKSNYGWVVQSGSNLAGIMALSGEDLTRSEAYLSEVEKFLPKVSDKRFLSSFYTSKGIFASNKKNHQDALENYQKAISISTQYKMIGELPFIYGKISEVYDEMGDFKNSSAYLKKASTLMDSLKTVENKAVELVLKSDKIEQDAKTNSKFLFLVAGILIVLLSMTIILKYWYKKRNSETKQVISGLKDTEITTSANYADLIQMVKENNEAFYPHFQEAFPDFIQKLLTIDPNLKSSDLEYCALLKLNFDTKKISTFKNTSVRAVESKKYRLRKRFNIPTDLEIHIFFNTL